MFNGTPKSRFSDALVICKKSRIDCSELSLHANKQAIDYSNILVFENDLAKSGALLKFILVNPGEKPNFDQLQLF